VVRVVDEAGLDDVPLLGIAGVSLGCQLADLESVTLLGELA
jgi:hypothetical protein